MTELNENYQQYIDRMVKRIPDDFYTYPISDQDACFHDSVSEFKGSLNKASVDISTISIDDRTYLIFTPAGLTGTGSGLFYIHGGGFLLGSTDIAHDLCVDYAHYLKMPVILPKYPVGEYSRYPETNKRMLDLYTAFQNKSAEFGVAPDQIVFGGESCGGYFAAALSFDIRQRGLMPFKAQLLVNPVIDLTRWAFFIEGGGIDHFYREMMQFTSHYCNGFHLKNELGLNPLAQEDFSNLPPAIIWVAGRDPLRFEANEYHQKLALAGGSSELIVLDGQIHGSLRGRNEYADCFQGFQELVDAIKRVTDPVFV